ncbi:MAG TPA: hypothetical protein PKC30_11840 [Saprospiraceae bacterium]|nr:hypothetical protein [Saprospiraceae bacterium]
MKKIFNLIYTVSLSFNNFQHPILFLMVFFLLQHPKMSSQQIPAPAVSDTILRTDIVDVVKTFEARLEEARMITVIPPAPVITPLERTYRYDVTIVPLELNFPDPVIRPISMKSDDPKQYLNHYLKAGYGNLKNAYVDLSIREVFDDINDWYINAYVRTGDDSENIAFQKYHDLRVKGGAGLSVFETSRLEIKAGLQQNQRHFFYNRDDRSQEFEMEDVRRNISVFNNGISFYNSFHQDAGVDYRIDLDNRFTRVSDLNENEINSRLYAVFTRKSTKNTGFTLAGGFDFNRSFGSTDVIGLFDPRLVVTGKKVLLEGGINYAYANSGHYLFPSVMIKWSIDDKAMQIIAGAQQTYHRNNLINTIEFNPFAKGMDTLNTRIGQEIFGGIQGKLADFTYQGKAGWRKVNHQVVFNVDFDDDLRRLDAITADLNVIFIQGNIEYDLNKRFTVGGILTRNFFSNVSTERMWHIFPTELNAYFRGGIMNDKLVLRADLFVRDRARVLDMGESVFLPGLFDLNAEIEVNPSKNFGIWAKALNLFNVNYSPWLGYPIFGIHFQGGILVRF